MSQPIGSSPQPAPPGYQPPVTARDLVQRYSAGERYFAGAQLARADLTGADLFEANLSDANLAGAVLRSAKLRKARLVGANLSGADLTDAVLWSADLSGATLDGAVFSSRVVLTHADFTGVNLNRARGELTLDSTVIRGTRFPAGSGRWGRLVHRLTGRYSIRSVVAGILAWIGRGFRKAPATAPRLAGSPPPPVAPRWVVLRRTYTGSRLAWVVLLTALFLLPLGWRTAFWIGVNHAQNAASPALADASQWILEREERLPAQLPDRADTALRRSAERVRGLLTPCLSIRCDTVSVIASLLRVGESPTGVARVLGRYGLTILLTSLLLFNVGRAWLTQRVGGLRDVEEESAVSPARNDYRGLWRAHLVVRGLQVVALVAFLDHAIALLGAEVAVPSGWFR